LKPLDAAIVKDTINQVLGTNNHQAKKVLVVDDDPNILDLLQQVFAETEFTFASAADGTAAVEAIQTNKPDILLLDLVMPKMDGFEVIEHLRSQPETRSLPVIVISAKDLSPEEIHQLNNTVQAIMQKQSLAGGELLEEIRAILNPDLHKQ
jgi:DNA-binding response OmpR family regulator